MGISTGVILLMLGLIGCIGCIAAIIICRRKWDRQREEMLRWIGDEDR